MSAKVKGASGSLAPLFQSAIRVFQQHEGNALVFGEVIERYLHTDTHRCFHRCTTAEALRPVELMGHEVGEVFIRCDCGDDFDTGGGIAIRAWVPLLRYIRGGEREIHGNGMGLVELRCACSGFVEWWKISS